MGLFSAKDLGGGGIVVPIVPDVFNSNASAVKRAPPWAGATAVLWMDRKDATPPSLLNEGFFPSVQDAVNEVVRVIEGDYGGRVSARKVRDAPDSLALYFSIPKDRLAAHQAAATATSPSATLPPPGWYQDPDGGASLRWWDGEVWTDHRKDP